MMDEIPGGAAVNEKLFHIYENERYSPLSKWSSKSLFPTDRLQFTTLDGSDGFKDIQEVNKQLLMEGWNWLSDETWIIDSSATNMDEEGWTYASNFGDFKDFESGTSTKAMMHFVRRRRLIRKQYFDASLLCPDVEDFTCSYCDLQEVELLYNLLLDKLSEASAYKHPTKNSNSKIVALKNRLLLMLFNKNDNISSKNISYHINIIENKCDLFIKENKNTWSTVSSMLATDSIDEIKNKRNIEFLQFYFTIDEGYEICRLLIRKYDFDNHFHCNMKKCNNVCQFAIDICPNEGCNVLFSRKWAPNHDEKCGYKLLNCSRDCGVVLKRMFLGEHLENTCILRVVKCPLYDFGCCVEILAKDLNDHIQSTVGEHMALVLNRLIEIQNVVNTHQSSIKDLYEINEKQDKKLITITAGLATAVATQKASEARIEKYLQDEIKTLDQKIRKNDAAILAERNDLFKLKEQLFKKP